MAAARSAAVRAAAATACESDGLVSPFTRPPKHTFQSSTSSHSPVVVDDLDMQPVARLCALREELQRSEGAQWWADVAEPGSQRLPIILVGRLHGGRRS